MLSLVLFWLLFWEKSDCERMVTMEILKNFANLLKVKTIVTLAVIAVFVILALRGSITADNVMVIVSSVVAFYFGTQHEKKA